MSGIRMIDGVVFGFNWIDPVGLGQYRQMLPPTGNYAEGGNPSPTWSNIRGDPGGNAFADSEWVVEINERSVENAMPSLSDCAIYSEWGIEAQRWDMMLYIHPVGLGIYYFINNLKGPHQERTYWLEVS